MSSRTLPITDDLHDYLLDVGVREPDVARRLREATQAMPKRNMQISPEQGQMMAFLVKALGVRHALEIGTFTGYSALRVARALPPEGRLVCCDVSEEWTSMGRPYWEEAGIADRIDLRIAPAEETLRALLDAGEAGTYDWAFIDADKTGYVTYVDLCHRLLRQGGVIAVDNVLWGGSVLDEDDESDDTVAIRALNVALRDDPRFHLVLVPIGDGLTLLRKR